MPITTLPKENYINTGKNGELDRTTTADIDAIFQTLTNRNKIVLHFHGGLVSYDSAMAAAVQLYNNCYNSAGAHPIFFVYETGFLETIQHHAAEIFGEDIFKILLKWLLKYAVGKIEGGATKGPLVALPRDIAIYTELAKLDVNDEPYKQLRTTPATTEVTAEEEADFIANLTTDVDLQATVAAIVKATLPANSQADNAKGIVIKTRASGRTLMSPDVVRKMQVGEGEKGLISTAFLIKKAAVILVRIVRRFLQKRDHGLYPTVVEEIFREFYIANLGVKIWAAMKDETSLTFNAGGGGEYFAGKLAELLTMRKDNLPEITLVGHSCGSVFVNNILNHVQTLKQADRIPADFKFSNCLLLAPACTFDHFQTTATTNSGLLAGFRIFTMTDAKESDNTLVKGVYTRSLLYFISGVLEPDGNGGVDFDKPLLGMNRYYVNPNVYPAVAFPAVELGRIFVTGRDGGVIWSPTTAPWAAGRGTTSLDHGDFDNNPDTLASLQSIITSGNRVN